MIDDIIATVVVLLILGGAITYIIKAKKSGKKCIGCPDSGSCGAKNTSSPCSGNCSCCSGCPSAENKQE